MTKVARVLGISSLGVGILFVAACGSSVTGTGGGGGATGGGSTGTVICPDEAAPCCDPQNPSPCCAQCTTTGTGGTATTGTGGSVTTGTGGAGGAQVCGGLFGGPCSPDDYCLYGDGQCGGNDGTGECTPRPVGCPFIYQPTCACNGMTYDNPCLAAAAGADVSDFAMCPAPQGMFGCGSGFCQIDSEYCLVVPSGVFDGGTSYTCEPAPAGCGDAPTCACLSQVACGSQCQSTPGGGIDLTCLTD